VASQECLRDGRCGRSERWHQQGGTQRWRFRQCAAALLGLCLVLLGLCIFPSSCTLSIHVAAQSSSDASLSSLVTGAGQLLPAFSPTSSRNNYIVGAWGSTIATFFTATLNSTGGLSLVEQRHTTGGITSPWVNLTSGVAGPWIGPPIVLNDLFVDIRVTAPDGITQRTWMLDVRCDEASLNTPTVIPVDPSLPNPLFLNSAPGNWRIWLPVPGTFDVTFNVTGNTSPQCAAQIKYYVGEPYPSNVLPPLSMFSNSTTPGTMVQRMTIRMGYTYVWLLAITPAERWEWYYYQASPDFAGFELAIPPFQFMIDYDLEFCEPFDQLLLEQPLCQFAYYVSNMTVTLYHSPIAPATRAYMNGQLLAVLNMGVFTMSVVAPLQLGLNTLRIESYTSNYTRQYYVPPPGSGYPPMVLRIAASTTELKTGSGLLLLTGELEGGEPQSTADELTWKWSSVPYINFSDAAQARNQSHKQVLITQDTLALAPGTYVFTGEATDGITRPDQYGHRRTSTASITVTVKPVIITIPTNPNNDTGVTVNPPSPCQIANPCQNDGVCSSVAVANTSVPTPTEPASYVSISGTLYALSCTCRVTEPQFFGSDCSFAVLGCPRCMARYAEEESLTVLGIGLSSALQLTIAGVQATMKALRIVNASEGTYVSEALDSLTKAGVPQQTLMELTFIAPQLLNATVNASSTSPSSRRLLGSDSPFASNVNLTDPIAIDESTGQPIDAYVPMKVEAVLPGSSIVEVLQFNTLVYYTSSQCLAEGEWKPNGAGGCLMCPTGAYCPGAGRVWPQKGYYGYSEYTAPASCLVEEACTGMNSKLGAGSGSGTLAYFAPGNEAAKCNKGYQGVKCADCADGFYQLGDYCYACDASVDQSTQLALIALAAIAVIVSLSICVAVLSTASLCSAVGSFLMLQQIATIGVSAAPYVPTHTKQVQTFFAWFNLINFDLQLLRPGCGGLPTFTYVEKYWATIIFMILTAVLFLIACIARYFIKKRQYEKNSGTRTARVLVVASPSRHGRSTDGTQDDDDVDHDNDGGDDLPLPPDTPTNDFNKRLQHSLLILLSIMYFRITMLLCENFICAFQTLPIGSVASNAPIDEDLMLVSDGSTSCYVGKHAVTTAVSIILMVVFLVGFPFYLFVCVLRALGTAEVVGCSGWMWRRFAWVRGDTSGSGRGSAHAVPSSEHSATMSRDRDYKEKAIELCVKGDVEGKLQKQKADRATSLAVRLAERNGSDRFGFLYDGLRSSHPTHVVGMLPYQSLYGVIAVFLANEATLQLFLFGTLTAIDAVHTAWAQPWDGFNENVKSICISSASLVQGVILLGTQTDGVLSPYFGLLVAECALVAFALIGMNAQHRKTRIVSSEHDTGKTETPHSVAAQRTSAPLSPAHVDVAPDADADAEAESLSASEAEA